MALDEKKVIFAHMLMNIKDYVQTALSFGPGVREANEKAILDAFKDFDDLMKLYFADRGM